MGETVAKGAKKSFMLSYLIHFWTLSGTGEVPEQQ
jgi:hypothetical protein